MLELAGDEEVETGVEEEATTTSVVGVGVAVESDVDARVRESFTLEVATPAAVLVEDFVRADAALADETADEVALTMDEEEEVVATTFTALEVFWLDTAADVLFATEAPVVEATPLEAGDQKAAGV